MLPGGALAGGVLLPAALTFAVFALLAWPSSTRRAAAAVATGAGFAAGHWAIAGTPRFPATQAAGWLFWLALAAALVALVEALRGKATLRHWALRGALLTATAGLLVRPLVAHSWGAGKATIWIAGLVAAGLALWWTGLRPEKTRAPAADWLDVALAAGATAVALSLSGSLLLGQLAGAFAAAAGGGLLRALLPGAPADPPRIPGLVVVVMGGLLVAGMLYAELPALSAALLVASPFVWRVVLPRLARHADLSTIATRALAVAVLAGLAVMIAWYASPSLEPYYGRLG